MEQAQIHSYFEAQRPWLTQFFSGLLSIPSESGSEAAAQQYLYTQLRQLGLQCELQPISNSLRSHEEYSFPVRDLDYTGRSNLILRQPGSGRHMALNTHVDVVPPSPGQENPYTPRFDADGTVWARGACDAKGQVAAMALLFKAAAELPSCGNALTGHIVVEEEYGGNGTLAALLHEPDFTADVLLNLEPTDLRLSPSIRGAVWFDMTFPGVAGHAGSSKNTLSATDKAIAVIGLLKDYHKSLLARSRGCGLFAGMDNPMPLTIGLFQAGVWPAMVPGEARIAGVLGFLPNMTKDAVIAELHELLEKPENRWLSDGATIEFVYRHNAVQTPPEHEAVCQLRAACRACGADDTLAAMTASSDGIFYQERGIPAIAFGPGRISDAHSCHENVRLDDILRAAEILYTFYCSM